MIGRWMTIGAALSALGGVLALAGGPEASSPGAVESGARYGQAMGAAAVCRGVRLARDAEALRARFQGSDLRLFDGRAAEVARLWGRMASCAGDQHVPPRQGAQLQGRRGSDRASG